MGEISLLHMHVREEEIKMAQWEVSACAVENQVIKQNFESCTVGTKIAT